MFIAGYKLKEGVSEHSNWFSGLYSWRIQLILFSSFATPTVLLQQEIACDSFWYKRSHEQRRPALPLPSIQVTGVRGTTKEQRRLQLMSVFGPVLDAACCTIGKTEDLLQILAGHMNKLAIQDESSLPQVAEPPTVMSTIVTAATAAAPAVTQEDEGEDFPILAHLGAANPPTANNQKQKRIKPRSGAPTGKLNKAAAKRGQRERKKSRKTADNIAQGKTKAGNNAY
jgi:hypothetical protein